MIALHKFHLNNAIYLLSFACITVAISLAFLLKTVPVPFYPLSFFCIAFWYILEIKTFRMTALNGIVFMLIFVVSLFIIFNQLEYPAVPFQMITFLSNLLVLQIIHKKHFSKDSHLLLGVFFISFVGTSIFGYAFFVNRQFWFASKCFTIGVLNPQILGSWSYVYACMLILFFDYLSFKKQKYIFVIKIVILLFIVYMISITIATESRTAMLGILVVLMFHFLPMITVLKIKEFSWVYAGIPFIICIGSIIIYSSGIGKGALGNSFLNGREELWIKYLKDSFFSPVLGYGENIHTKYTHNMFVDHVLMFGYPISAFYMVVLGMVLYFMSGCMKNRITYDGYLCFLISLVQGAAEGHFFLVGAGGLFLYAFSFLLIIKLTSHYITPTKKAGFIKKYIFKSNI